MKIVAGEMHFEDLNRKVRYSEDVDVEIDNCLGQRYIGDALSGKNITIKGIPGNALGAYLDGSIITVYGNAQDATGDTMNDGAIYVHGSSGDATGYAMRGGRIIIKDNAGYRLGIHMKAYKEKAPVIVVGGMVGDFCGEYQAGGLIIVLGINAEGKVPVGSFCGVGMHGGKIFLRCDRLPNDLPNQVSGMEADENDLKDIEQYINEFCEKFGESKENIMKHKFFKLVPNTKNPYKQLYTHN